MEKNLYEILGISKYSSTENIENTYNILKIKYQEKYKGEENKLELEKRLAILKNAYEILHDNKKRSEYDRFLEEKEASKKEIEENIRNINEEDFEKSINNTFEMSDDIQLPEVEELSKEEIENKKQEIEQEKVEKEKHTMPKININPESKAKIEVSIIFILAVLMIIVASIVFINSKIQESKQEEPFFAPEDLEVLDKKIKTGERLPEEVLKITSQSGKFENVTGLWFYYSEDYNIYYRKSEVYGIELYYDSNLSLDDGALWIYDHESLTSMIYEEKTDCFVGYNSNDKKVYAIRYDKQEKIFTLLDYETLRPADEEDDDKIIYIEYETTQHTIYKEDINGNIYFINKNDQFEEAEEGDYALFTDNRGRICYVDKVDGTRYYIDEYSYLKYYRDEEGRYYFDGEDLRYYEYDIIDGCPYYRDINGNIFCREEDGSKLYDYEDMLLTYE